MPVSEKQADQSLPIRYMGTKRRLTSYVAATISELHPVGPVADLFSGMGSIAASLAPHTPVVTNDALAFTTAFARSRFLEQKRTDLNPLIRRLIKPYGRRRGQLRKLFRERLAAERNACEAGSESLREYMVTAPHVGGSCEWGKRAAIASGRRDSGRYNLATLYFSGAYFSTPQAIDLDSIRFAIDQACSDGDRDWALSAWLSAAGTLINAPGHTAQFLMPNSMDAFKRIARQWDRGAWPLFLDRLRSLSRVGTRAWRLQNAIHNEDALRLVHSLTPEDVGLIYADPPYTKDQYSRFYHVYETLYLYDHPTSSGRGRYRSGRFVTPFSLLGEVERAFCELFQGVLNLGRPLVLSYPSDGVLNRAGTDIESLLDEHFSTWACLSIDHRHSTLGASKGPSRMDATEKLFICEP